jgi:hypothetical protein
MTFTSAGSNWILRVMFTPSVEIRIGWVQPPILTMRIWLGSAIAVDASSVIFFSHCAPGAMGTSSSNRSSWWRWSDDEAPLNSFMVTSTSNTTRPPPGSAGVPLSHVIVIGAR